MRASGIEVLFLGSNFARLLEGLWVTVRISLLAVLLSLPLGILFGLFMTLQNPIARAVSRVYLEFIRIMPQLVLLFIAYFGVTRAFGWNWDAEFSARIRSRNEQTSDFSVYYHSPDTPKTASSYHQSHHAHDQDHKPCGADRNHGGAESRQADHRREPLPISHRFAVGVRSRICTLLSCLLADLTAGKILGKTMEVTADG